MKDPPLFKTDQPSRAVLNVDVHFPRGKKEKWFLLRMLAEDGAVQLDMNDKPEFDHWQWVSYWYPLDQVISFKREVYRKAMKELALPLGRHTEQRAGF